MLDRSTRLTIPVLVVTGVAAVGLGVGLSQAGPLPPAEAPPPVPAVVDAVGSLGLVRVDYRFERQPGHASNQYAVWIEDAAGAHVRTLFATSFTAEGGYQRRPMSLPTWRAAAGWDGVGEDQVRAVARPVPESGTHSVYWDGLDAAGRPVPPGSYRFLVEGNVRWENRVLHTGTIEIGPAAGTGAAGTEFLPPEAAALGGGMLSGVRAEFLPGQRVDPAEVTTYTRGS